MIRGKQLETADATTPGAISTSSQSIAGVKTFTSGLSNISPTLTAVVSFSASPYTILPDTLVAADTSLGSIVFNLPITPPANTCCWITDAKSTWDQHSISISSTLIHGITQGYTYAAKNSTLCFKYTDATTGWILLSLQPVTSSGSTVVHKELDIDFGTKPRTSATINIIDAQVSATSTILVYTSSTPVIGKTTSDWDMDAVQFTPKPIAGSFKLFCICMSGKILGKRRIRYSIA
jgi:hypothetical protein